MRETETLKLAEEYFVGRKIISVAYLSHEQSKKYGWTYRPMAFVLDDDTMVFPVSDEECGEAGVLSAIKLHGREWNFGLAPIIEKTETLKLAEEYFVGHKIIGAMYLSWEQVKEYQWGNRPMALGLDNGTIVFPVSDEEGTTAGVLVAIKPPDGKEQMLY